MVILSTYPSMTPPKEKSTEIIASDVNFESLSNNFTLYSKYRGITILFARIYFSENESRETSSNTSPHNDTLRCVQHLLINFFYFPMFHSSR